MTTKTKVSLDVVLKAVADAGFPLTEKEAEVVRRRLATGGTYLGRPDPLAGTERDAVEAVDHVFDERGGPLARNIDGPAPVASLIDGYEPPRDEDEDLRAEVERLREENETLRVGGPGHLARVEQVKESSAGPLDSTPAPADEHLASKVEPKAEVKGQKTEAPKDGEKA